MKWSLKCGYVLVFGLCLYLLDIGLHVGIAVQYLTMQGCHRGVSHTFTNFQLSDLLDLDQLNLQLTEEDNQAVDESISSKLSDFLDDSLYLHLRKKIIRILPQHWIERIVKIITFQAGKYKGSDIAKMCRLNGQQFQSLAEMAVFVCDNAFTSSNKEVEASRAARALTTFIEGENNRTIPRGLNARTDRCCLEGATDLS